MATCRIELFPVLVLSLATWYIIEFQRKSPELLAERYGGINLPESVLPNKIQYSRQASDSTKGSTLATGDDTLQTGLRTSDSARYFLRSRNYSEALSYYERIKGIDATDSLRFERAILLLKGSKAQDALQDLNEIDQTFSGGFFWYKALSYLQLSDRKSAGRELENIMNLDESPYQLDARQLLKDL